MTTHEKSLADSSNVSSFQPRRRTADENGCSPAVFFSHTIQGNCYDQYGNASPVDERVYVYGAAGYLCHTEAVRGNRLVVVVGTRTAMAANSYCLGHSVGGVYRDGGLWTCRGPAKQVMSLLVKSIFHRTIQGNIHDDCRDGLAGLPNTLHRRRYGICRPWGLDNKLHTYQYFTRLIGRRTTNRDNSFTGSARNRIVQRLPVLSDAGLDNESVRRNICSATPAGPPATTSVYIRLGQRWHGIRGGSNLNVRSVARRGVGKSGRSRWPHKPEIAGSNPASPTHLIDDGGSPPRVSIVSARPVARSLSMGFPPGGWI